jgi:regulator of protease activity HflC (stomatin/prohibitin superfamily)
MGPIIGILVFFIVLVLFMLRQINQYERGVMFTLGRFTGLKEPGWRIVVPVFQSLTKVDIRTKAVDVPDQEAITKDNIPVKINAVVYYRITDSGKAILAVENYFWATSQVAQTTMRNAVGEVTLDDLLQNRAEIAEKIKKTVDRQTDPWGIDVESLELKDVIIPENLKRTISKEAEAEREKRAVIITAEGEKIAARNITDAAQMLAEAPGALHLRTLQSINDLSSDQSNTTIWMVPVEGFAALRGVADKLGVKTSDTKDV